MGTLKEAKEEQEEAKVECEEVKGWEGAKAEVKGWEGAKAEVKGWEGAKAPIKEPGKADILEEAKEEVAAKGV